jgi:hypothetical protein
MTVVAGDGFQSGGIVSIKWSGDHEKALKMSATRSSIGLATSLYCFGAGRSFTTNGLSK